MEARMRGLVGLSGALSLGGVLQHLLGPSVMHIQCDHLVLWLPGADSSEP